MTTFFTSECVASLEWSKFALTKIDDNGRYGGPTKDTQREWTFERVFLRSEDPYVRILIKQSNYEK